MGRRAGFWILKIAGEQKAYARGRQGTLEMDVNNSRCREDLAFWEFESGFVRVLVL